MFLMIPPMFQNGGAQILNVAVQTEDVQFNFYGKFI
jgi:hypothetical protein